MLGGDAATFFCTARAGPRGTFVQRLPHLAPLRTRRTPSRLTASLRGIGCVYGGSLQAHTDMDAPKALPDALVALESLNGDCNGCADPARCTAVTLPTATDL